MIAVETKKLRKVYNGFVAVDCLDLKINKGELFSLLGTNGAGKTTTIKMISSLIIPTEGEVIINDKRLDKNKIALRNILNLSPQETAIAPNLSVIENLKFMAGVYSIRNKEKKINELIEMFDLGKIIHQKAKTLSGGWQRKLSIALSLINEPEILFLDEPTLGLDVISRRELWRIIDKLKGKVTIILTTHYMEEAEKLSDRIGIMTKGKLICVGTTKELILKAKANNFEDAFVTLATGGEL